MAQAPNRLTIGSGYLGGLKVNILEWTANDAAIFVATKVPLLKNAGGYIRGEEIDGAFLLTIEGENDDVLKAIVESCQSQENKIKLATTTLARHVTLLKAEWELVKNRLDELNTDAEGKLRTQHQELLHNAQTLAAQTQGFKINVGWKNRTHLRPDGLFNEASTFLELKKDLMRKLHVDISANVAILKGKSIQSSSDNMTFRQLGIVKNCTITIATKAVGGVTTNK